MFTFLTQLGDCLNDVSGWITNNRFRLNADKTDFIIIGTSRQCSKLTRFFPMPILHHSITPSHIVRNLQVTFDSNLYFRNISLLFLFPSPKHSLQHSLLVTSLITGTLFHVASYLRILQNLFFFSFCATPEITSLAHVQSCIIFKLCTIVFQILSSGEPSYLFSMLSISAKHRELLSSSFHLLYVPRVKTHVGTHVSLWN